MAKCLKCPAEIQFVQMVKQDGSVGKTGVLDAEPSEKGNVRLVKNAKGMLQGRVLTGEELAFAQTNKEPLRISHFVTCPARDQFRRKP